MSAADALRRSLAPLLADFTRAERAAPDFATYCRLRAFAFCRMMLVISVAGDVLWWWTDAFAFPDPATFSSVLQLRIAFFVSMVGAWVSLEVAGEAARERPWRRVIPWLLGFTAFGAAWLGCMSSERLPLGFTVLIVVVGTVVFPLPPVRRGALNLALVAVAGAAFRLVRDEPFASDSTTFLFGIFAAFCSTVIGHLVFRLERAGFDQRREIEEHLRRADELAKLKDAFVATVSHELRTPLHAIIGLTEASLRHELAGDLKSQLGTVRDCGEVLLDLVNDILDLSQIRAGALELERAPYEVRDLVESTAAVVAATCAEKGLAFSHRVDPALPPLLGDARRVGQILRNLIGNAVKFTDAGEVQVLAGEEGGRLVVEVRDTGPGVPETARERIFEEFVRADDPRTRSRGGTGLGLAIARKLAERMGGSLEVGENRPRGAVFTLRLPLEAAGPARVVAVQQGRGAGAAGIDVAVQQGPRGGDGAVRRAAAREGPGGHVAAQQDPVTGPSGGDVAVQQASAAELHGDVALQQVGAPGHVAAPHPSDDGGARERAAPQHDVTSAGVAGQEPPTPAPVVLVHASPALRLRNAVDTLTALGAEVRVAHGVDALVATLAREPRVRAVLVDDARLAPAKLKSTGAPAACEASGIPLVAAFDPRRMPLAGSMLPSVRRIFSPARFDDLAALLLDDVLAAPVAAEAPAPRRRVLVVDDVRENRLVAEAHLAGTSWDAVLAETGEEALATFDRQRFDVVLLDIEMPGMDGFVALQQLRAREAERGLPRTPVLAMTAHAAAELQKRSRDGGFDGHVLKPAKRRELLEALARAVGETRPVADDAGAMPARAPARRLPVPKGSGAAAAVNDDQVPRELAQSFLARASTDAERLERDFSADLEPVRSFGHRVAGAAGTFGFDELGELGRELDLAARRGDAAACRDVLGRMRALTRREAA